MQATFQAVDPRTGAPGADLRRGHAGRRPRGRRRGRTRRSAPARCAIPRARAALLRGAAARLRAAGDEIVAVAGAETGLPEARLRGELERTAGQLEAFAAVVDAGDYVEAIIDRADPDAKPIPRPDVRRMLVPDRPGGRVRRQQLPARLLDRGRRHRLRAGRRLPGGRQGPPVAPGHERGGGARAGRRGGRRRPARRRRSRSCSPAGIEVGEALVDEPAIAAVGFTGSFAGGKALYDRAAARARPDPGLRRDGQRQPDRRHRGGADRAQRGDRRGPGRLGRVLRRPAVHQARRRVRPRRRGGRRVRRRPRRAAGRRRAAGPAQRAPARRADRARSTDLDALADAVDGAATPAEPGLPLPARAPTARRRPTCASTPTCWRSTSAPSCCC